MPFRVAFDEYVGPMPFFVVPKLCPFSEFSVSCKPSTCWWKSNTKCARSEMYSRSSQSDRPFFSFFSNSSKRPGKWMTTPLPGGKIKNVSCFVLFYSYYKWKSSWLMAIRWQSCAPLTCHARSINLKQPTAREILKNSLFAINECLISRKTKYVDSSLSYLREIKSLSVFIDLNII